MMFNVPQFIDVEDKIAGPLTWRQILWMIGMVAILLVLYNIFDSSTFFTLAIPVILLFSALAFYRPNGVSMIEFLTHGVFFLFQPKVSVWERPVVGMTSQNVSSDEKIEVAPHETKHYDSKRVHELAELLDHHD